MAYIEGIIVFVGFVALAMITLVNVFQNPFLRQGFTVLFMIFLVFSFGLVQLEVQLNNPNQTILNATEQDIHTKTTNLVSAGYIGLLFLMIFLFALFFLNVILFTFRRLREAQEPFNTSKDEEKEEVEKRKLLE